MCIAIDNLNAPEGCLSIHLQIQTRWIDVVQVETLPRRGFHSVVVAVTKVTIVSFAFTHVDCTLRTIETKRDRQDLHDL